MWSQFLSFCFALPLYGNRQANPPPTYHFTFPSLWLTALLFAMALPLTGAGGASPHFAGPQREDVVMPRACGDTATGQLVCTGKEGRGLRVELPSLPVFARVPGGRPGQPNSAAGRCQNFTEENCTSLFHWSCRTIKEHPAEYVTHTCLISFTVSVLIYAQCVFIKQRFIGTWNFMTWRFAWVQIVSFSFWKRRFKRAHLPVALLKP